MKTLLEQVKDNNALEITSQLEGMLKQKTLEAIQETRKQVAADTFGMDFSTDDAKLQEALETFGIDETVLFEAMSKQHYVGLADHIKASGVPFSHEHLKVLSGFMKKDNPKFDADRWHKYVSGEAGPNGGKKKVHEAAAATAVPSDKEVADHDKRAAAARAKAAPHQAAFNKQWHAADEEGRKHLKKIAFHHDFDIPWNDKKQSHGHSALHNLAKQMGVKSESVTEQQVAVFEQNRQLMVAAGLTEEEVNEGLMSFAKNLFKRKKEPSLADHLHSINQDQQKKNNAAALAKKKVADTSRLHGKADALLAKKGLNPNKPKVNALHAKADSLLAKRKPAMAGMREEADVKKKYPVSEEYLTEVSQAIPWPSQSKDLKNYTRKKGETGAYSHPDGHKVEFHGNNEWTHTSKNGSVKKGKGMGDLHVHVMKTHGDFDNKVKEHEKKGWQHCSTHMGKLSYAHHKKHQGDHEDNAVDYKAAHRAAMNIQGKERKDARARYDAAHKEE